MILTHFGAPNEGGDIWSTRKTHRGHGGLIRPSRALPPHPAFGTTRPCAPPPGASRARPRPRDLKPRGRAPAAMSEVRGEPGSGTEAGVRFFCTAGRGLEPFLMREVRARLAATEVSGPRCAPGKVGGSAPAPLPTRGQSCTRESDAGAPLCSTRRSPPPEVDWQALPLWPREATIPFFPCLANPVPHFSGLKFLREVLRQVISCIL